VLKPLPLPPTRPPARLGQTTLGASHAQWSLHRVELAIMPSSDGNNLK